MFKAALPATTIPYLKAKTSNTSFKTELRKLSDKKPWQSV